MYLFKKYAILVSVLGIALFLRIYKLDTLMQFIPDQGWFYLSARDMLLTGQVPLVGPPTSHPWIHHGPLWTYTLALILLLFNFNPVAPAYFIAFLGVFTVWMTYEVGRKMFSRKVGLIGALLFATSPLIVTNSRIPYHTSPIPFLVLLLFYLTYLWVDGRKKLFPFMMFILAILYNHEITTAVFGVAIALLFLYGLKTKKKWAHETLNIKIILLSALLFILPLIPFVLHDLQHGYKQTLGFVVWMGYRVVKFPLSFFDKSLVSSGSNPSTLSEFLTYYQELIFVKSGKVSLIILMMSLITSLVLFWKGRDRSLGLLFLFFLVSFAGLFMHRVPIEADTLLMAPFFILFLAILIEQMLLKASLKVVGIIILAAIVSVNTYVLISTDFFTTPGPYYRLPYYERLKAVQSVIQLTKNSSYNIIGKGELSDFPVFLDPYRYLLWYYGNPPSMKGKNTIEIWEQRHTISVKKLK